ncbi:hypothetical protein CANINC_004744 [Pichia inconspicua]|uniref:ENTH domain-containing protein n=1 Tax=Pichia inconspicua TaxID=52247 RepID=A0A4T0WW38_9ASCO|nr:hypothetical protein CANINC_004744 [[Candida] inconspicua]
MDISKGLNNLSLWEVKSYVRKAQNAVLNLSETEAKVREATNNEPWGASTTLMADIARGTFNYRDREEICNMIFRRFTEKSAHEWRQIYKSLQLMEYLVKNGSERFVDDARANVSLVSMLKSFHYIDSKGVDQGINIRNRAKELAALLTDENKIRIERKKAKENAKKFDAISSTSAGSRNLGRRNNRSAYGANAAASASSMGDDYENRIFGDGGVFGQRFEENRTTQSAVNNSAQFEEYDEDVPATIKQSRSSEPTTQTSKVNAPAIDLFDFSDEQPTGNQNTATKVANDEDDDDFDDFQSAVPTQPVQTAPVSQQATSSPLDFFNQPTSSTPVINQQKPVDDIFGSLLSSAKQTTLSSPPVKQTSTFKTQNSTPTTPYKTSSQPQQSSGGVVDLLDL